MWPNFHSSRFYFNGYARAALVLLILICLQLISVRKELDFIISTAWYLITIACLSIIFYAYQLNRKIRLLSFCLIHFIYLLDIELKSWIVNSIGFGSDIYNDSLNKQFETLATSLYQTNSQEALEFVTFNFSNIAFSVAKILFPLLILIYYEFLIYKISPYKIANKSKKIFAFSMLFIWFLLHFQPHTSGEPFVFYSQVIKNFITNKKAQDDYQQIFKNNEAKVSEYKITASQEPEILVLVIGESASAKDWQIFGYPRATNKFISKIYLNNEILAFNKAYASIPTTVFMLQRLLSPATYKNPNLWQSEPNIIQIAKAAGYKTYWFSNQSASGMYNNYGASLAKSSDEYEFFQFKNKTSSASNFDEVLIQPLNKALSDPGNKKLIVLHLIGSHISYASRFPENFKLFNYDTSDAVTNELKLNGRSDNIIENRNNYDNSIAYTDWLLNEFIAEIKKNNPTVKKYFVYLSDHGEEVGHEKNIASHSATAAGLNVPLIMWSNNYNNLFNPLNKNIENKYFVTDGLFNSLLTLLNIKIAIYEASADILNPQYAEPDFGEIQKLFIK